MNKREVKFADKEEIKREWQTREAFFGEDVTNLIVSSRDGKGKRFRVFTTELSHQHGTDCRFSSNDNGATYQCFHCSRQLSTKGKKKDQFFIV